MDSRNHKKLFTALLIIFVFSNIFAQEEADYSKLKLNEIQIIGSHNSYKKAIHPKLWKLIELFSSDLANSLQYEHISLTEQLNLGLRNLEIDVVHDPEGGRFQYPLGNTLLNIFLDDPIVYDINKELSKPGLKVMHQPDFDFRSHNLTFINCLSEIKNWSENHKDHIPIFITMNTKDKKYDIPGTAELLPFTKEVLKTIDEEILRVFNIDQLITPDLIQGDYKSLEEAILVRGWPTIEDLKGRILFVLDENGERLEDYLNNDKSLTNKVLFTNSEEGNPSAAFRIINDPVKNQEYIKGLIQKGYIVRTRADAGTKEARNNDYKRFEKAKSSGAQIITTDYYIPSKLFNSDFQIFFDDNNYIRKNILINSSVK